MGKPTARLTMVDMAFAVSGGRLPRDHSLELWQALERAVPSLAEDDTTAVLPIRAASAGDLGLVLARRSRLLMRLDEARVAAALELCGKRLDLGAAKIEVGAAKTRPLAPYATLYSHRVAAENCDEQAFVEQVARALARLGIHSEFIVGKRSGTRGAYGELTGFSLMLADLAPHASLVLQAAGLGDYRQLGFGVFVGHK
jgi:CRISPR-associated protein Cas6